MHTAYLGLGSNIEAERNIASAIARLHETFDGIEFSPFYRCTPFGFEGEDFINGVARVTTGMMPMELKNWLIELENQHGRDREVPKYSSRTLDVDILLYDDLVTVCPALTIPHPRMHKRRFVLQPICDINPNIKHPVLKITVQGLLNRLCAETQRIVAEP